MSWWLGGEGTLAGVKQKIRDLPVSDTQPTAVAMRGILLDILARMQEESSVTVNGVYVNAAGHDGGDSPYLQVEVRRVTLVLDPPGVADMDKVN